MGDNQLALLLVVYSMLTFLVVPLVIVLVVRR